MTSLLRQIVAGPRAKHAETGLDLCYVTSNMIATSGPSQTYPQRAYRNPLDRLVAFLDARHGSDWAIWEFRAEGTGYPDEAVHNRVRHYPWPDHHPPPFRLVPMILASMRNWLAGGDLFTPEDEKSGGDEGSEQKKETDKEKHKTDKKKRVVVVHCKAGKGRSGTATCSYLIAECGWTPEEALARFTERRMRPRFGAGVSIPSQLRWISYVDRWTRGGKKYIDRAIEIVEVHVWGLRHGVKVSVEGFADEGKRIKVLHTFRRDERYVVEEGAPGGGGVMDLLGDALSPKLESEDEEVEEEADYGKIVGGPGNGNGSNGSGSDSPSSEQSSKSKPGGSVQELSRYGSKKAPRKSKTIQMPEGFSSSPLSGSSSASLATSSPAPPKDGSNRLPGVSDPKAQSQFTLPMRTATTFADQDEPGGQAVIFKPRSPVVVPNSDVNIAMERRNRAPSSLGLTMVTAVAHVWFNAFFEGRGPERRGEAEDSGVFEIEWDRMDGIKGSSRKGTRAADRISVVWRAVGAGGGEAGKVGEAAEGGDQGKVVIAEPAEGEAVPQMEPADWKGGDKEGVTAEKRLGLRVADPESAAVSKASSVKSQEIGDTPGSRGDAGADADEDDSLKGVKTSGPSGEEELDGGKDADGRRASGGPGDGPAKEDAEAGSSGGTAQKGFIVE